MFSTGRTACRRHIAVRGNHAAHPHIDGAQAEIAADAVFDMGDEIAGREARGFGEEFCARFDFARGRTMRSPRMSCSAMMAKSRVSKPARCRSTPTPTALACSFIASGQFADRAHRRQSVIGQYAAQAIGRTFAPGRDETRFFCGQQRLG